MKVEDYKQPIFIDRYFFVLTLILNCFIWFLVMLWLIFLITSRSKWPVDKKIVTDLTDGQDLAIYYIKDARKFIIDIYRKKAYCEADQEKMESLLDGLNAQFNLYRGQAVLIMDSLLETIDSLRLLQKNYETDTELFNFDYREELVQMAVERDRIFTLNKFAKNPDEMLGD